MYRIRELRKQHGITAKKLGEFLNVAESTISLYENGKRSPDYATLNRLADFFGVSVDYILGREEKKTEQPTEYDGLSEKQKTLIDFAKSVPEDKADMILKVIRSIVEAD